MLHLKCPPQRKWDSKLLTLGGLLELRMVATGLLVAAPIGRMVLPAISTPGRQALVGAAPFAPSFVLGSYPFYAVDNHAFSTL